MRMIGRFGVGGEEEGRRGKRREGGREGGEGGEERMKTGCSAGQGVWRLPPPAHDAHDAHDFTH